MPIWTASNLFYSTDLVVSTRTSRWYFSRCFRMSFLLSPTPSNLQMILNVFLNFHPLEKLLLFFGSRFCKRNFSSTSLFSKTELQSTWFWLTNFAPDYREGHEFQAWLPDHQSSWPERLGQGLAHNISWSNERYSRVLARVCGTRALSWIWS